MKYAKLAITHLIFSAGLFCSAQEKATADLAFLVGKWDVERVNLPESDAPRHMTGTMFCSWDMDSTFIRCTYEMQRPGKIRGLDQVYFNHNKIYDSYESLWLSSTWPIKVLMDISIEEKNGQRSLVTSADFLIEGGVTEFVKGKLVLAADGQSFERKTHIRTSKDPEGQWTYWMIEKAQKKD